MNLKDILRNIEYTGRYNYEKQSDALFKHLILTKTELSFIEKLYNLKDFAKEYKIDFISLKCNGKIEFEHFSDIDNEESINEKGLIVGKEDWICDLGTGIYVVEEDDFTGKDNLNTYYENANSNDKLLKVTGSYEGDYTICIYGLNHEKYIVIKQNILSKNISTEIITIEEEFDMIF